MSLFGRERATVMEIGKLLRDSPVLEKNDRVWKHNRFEPAETERYTFLYGPHCV